MLQKVFAADLEPRCGPRRSRRRRRITPQ